jgi:hypothetical protein
MSAEQSNLVLGAVIALASTVVTFGLQILREKILRNWASADRKREKRAEIVGERINEVETAVTKFSTKLNELNNHIHELISTKPDETRSKLISEWVRDNLYNIAPAPLLDFANLAVINDKILRELYSNLVKSLSSMSNFADQVLQDQNTNDLAPIEEKFRRELEDMIVAYARILTRLDQLKIELHP